MGKDIFGKFLLPGETQDELNVVFWVVGVTLCCLEDSTFARTQPCANNQTDEGKNETDRDSFVRIENVTYIEPVKKAIAQ